MIEHKKLKLKEKSLQNFNPGDFSSNIEDDGEFVDFGLVALKE